VDGDRQAQRSAEPGGLAGGPARGADRVHLRQRRVRAVRRGETPDQRQTEREAGSVKERREKGEGRTSHSYVLPSPFSLLPSLYCGTISILSSFAIPAPCRHSASPSPVVAQ